MDQSLLRTPLDAHHRRQGARMVPFAGWSMPLQYGSIREEHVAVRTGVGLFDISHMGRITFRGPDAGAFLDRIVTRRASTLAPGRIRYALITNESGGILDDVLVYHVPTAWSFQLVVNAANRSKILAWLDAQHAGEDVQWQDQTFETAMLAVQGPRAIETAQTVLGGEPDLSALRYYRGCAWPAGGPLGLVSRTGYTGEDGCELIVSAAEAGPLWERLVEAGAHPAGLGARDTLRLEAALPLYGHEMDEATDPFEAGLGFAVELDGHAFIGSRALADRQARPAARIRVGLEVLGRRVARQGDEVFVDDQSIGRVTSGTYSPTLEKPIAMAYVTPQHASAGTPVEVDIRGRRTPAKIVSLPFYQRPR